MKKAIKIILVLLVLSIVLGAVIFVTSDGFTVMLALMFGTLDQEPEKSPIFSYGAMEIELTTDFENTMSTMNYDMRLISEDYDILIDMVTIESEMPAGGFTLAHLEEFMESYLFMLLKNDPEEIDVYEVDGILYYDVDQDLDGELDYIIAMYKYKNTFWSIQFRPRNASYEESKEQCIAWSKNVRFPEE